MDRILDKLQRCNSHTRCSQLYQKGQIAGHSTVKLMEHLWISTRALATEHDWLGAFA